MRRYRIVPWILLIFAIINVTLAAPAVLREIRHTRVDVMDVREDTIPVSRSEKLWDEPSSAVHPRTNSESGQPESDYEAALDRSLPDSFQTGTSEFQQELPEIETPPGEELSINSESHRVGEVSSENYLASNEGGPSGSSFSFTPKSGSQNQRGFLSKLVSNSKSFLSKFKNFFVRLAGKLKFWRRTSASVSV